MDISVVRRAALVWACLVLFSACGDLETLFPSNETYQVRTLVNGSSIEECSIIRTNDKIRPYFVVSVFNDPDLIGLLVYVQDSQGEIVGDRMQYTLVPYADETALTEADLLEQEEKEQAQEEETATEVTQSEEEINKYEEEEKTEEPVEIVEVNEHQTMERWSFTDFRPVEKNVDVEIAVDSLFQKLPYFSLPHDLKIGPYTLVFEAVGKRETLSRTETNIFYLGSAEFNLKDISMYLPGLSGMHLISPETVILLESSLDFDSRLDPYIIWYNGRNIISEGKLSDGAGQLLWKAPEQAGFYSLRMEALPFPLKRSVYTGLSREIALPVSPKAIDLGHFFENNKGHTARSSLSAGTAYPASLISPAATSVVTGDEAEPPVSYSAPKLLQWYQFDGSLRNALSTQYNAQVLMPANETSPRWAAAGQSYGLAVGQDDPYSLPTLNFFHEEKDQGGGIILLHVRPLSEGLIFNAFFPLQFPVNEGVSMDMIKEGNIITLRLKTADAIVELPVYLSFSAVEDFIPIAVEFYIRPYRLEAKISLDTYFQNKTGEIKLPGALSGEGRIKLGGDTKQPAINTFINTFINKSILETVRLETVEYLEDQEDQTIPDVAEILSASIPAAVETFPDTIWNELAILFSAVPLLPEELPKIAVEEEDANSTETEISLTDTDIDNSIQEQETQEREAQEQITPEQTAQEQIAHEQIAQERTALTVISENF